MRFLSDATNFSLRRQRHIANAKSKAASDQGTEIQASFMNPEIDPESLISTEEKCGDDGAAMIFKPKSGSDVWYRRPLQVLFRQSSQRDQARPKSIAYKQSFRQRSLRPVGIPIAQVADLHELIKVQYMQYSPFLGMIFAHNNLIANLYRYGDSLTEPIVPLIQQLYHVLPGGEVQPSHIERNAAALLTPGMVGALISNIFEKSRKRRVLTSAEMSRRISETLRQHPDYQLQSHCIQSHVVEAQNHLTALERAQGTTEPIRQEIQRLEGVVIKRTKHKLNRLQQEIAEKSSKERQTIAHRSTEQQQSLIQRYEKVMHDAQMEVDQLRSQLVTNNDLKQARKAINRARMAVEQQDSSLMLLGENLAKCWLWYHSDKSNEILPSNITEAVLVAFLWEKYDIISAFEPYFASLHEVGALTESLNKFHRVVERNSLLDSPTEKPVCRQIRSQSDLTRAVTVSMSKPCTTKRPAIIPFSYVSWAAYSEFPDCGETALRNLLNQVLYNPQLGRFDFELLSELRDKVFPDMKEVLIAFYRRRHHPHEASNQDAAREWIQVVSGLNAAVESKMRVRYRRVREQQNIASPLTNLLVAFNKLFGIEEITDVRRGIVKVIQEMRRFRPDANIVKVDIDAIRSDGFGILKLTDGTVQYELQSYKPVHFGFVQTDSAHADKKDYRTFRSVLKYVQCHKLFPKKPTNLEQIAVASLMVPYQIQRHSKLSRIKLPMHMVLLFADLDTDQQKRRAMEIFALPNGSTPSEEFTQSLLRGIQSYREPQFQPQRQKKHRENGHHKQSPQHSSLVQSNQS